MTILYGQDRINVSDKTIGGVEAGETKILQRGICQTDVGRKVSYKAILREETDKDIQNEEVDREGAIVSGQNDKGTEIGGVDVNRKGLKHFLNRFYNFMTGGYIYRRTVHD